jgi:stearoyl-CoA desaturase (delta-9 desaturase)
MRHDATMTSLGHVLDVHQEENMARLPRSTGDADRIDWVKSIPFLAVHLVALGAVVLGPFSWGLLALAIGSYYVRMFGITAGYHRYFSHRSYRTGRAFQLVLAVLGATTTQKGVLWWAAHHRDHHRFSDQPEDIHSPVQRGFWWSHVGWIMSRRYSATKLDRIKDFARYPELRWLDRFHAVPSIAYAAAMSAVGGVPALLWGYFVSTVLLWHGTFLVNSLAHVIGRRRYPTDDASGNSLLIALATMGEGWHNNHHHYQSTANQGWFWWEIDVTYYLLQALAALGIVSDLRTPSAAIRDAHRSVTTVTTVEAPRVETSVGA